MLPPFDLNWGNPFRSRCSRLWDFTFTGANRNRRMPRLFRFFAPDFSRCQVQCPRIFLFECFAELLERLGCVRQLFFPRLPAKWENSRDRAAASPSGEYTRCLVNYALRAVDWFDSTSAQKWYCRTQPRTDRLFTQPRAAVPHSRRVCLSLLNRVRRVSPEATIESMWPSRPRLGPCSTRSAETTIIAILIHQRCNAHRKAPTACRSS